MSNPDPKFSTEPRPGSPVRRVLPYLEPSSPVKATTNPGNIRIPGHVKNASARLPDIDVSDFMNLLSPEYDIKTNSGEETLYQPICDLLNACAAHVEEHMKVRGLNHAPLLFVIHADSAPSEHALGTKVRPDLVAVNASAEEIEYYRRTKNIAQQDEQKDGPEEQRKKSKQFVGVPWARLCMTIEVKPMVVKEGEGAGGNVYDLPSYRQAGLCRRFRALPLPIELSFVLERRRGHSDYDANGID
ncbi:hypothetical protein A0H81_00423 [Grifola frondosa]|uniref:Uncharacterized protein n=1 Tax=Grifola frondosa TaxID=5627 RepID=A0A1C7MT50_GRIFR|nr:hypothetical protein A0H81_00423 [Grifola frondosa]